MDLQYFQLSWITLIWEVWIISSVQWNISTVMKVSQKTRQCWNKTKSDCVYLKCVSWDVHHKNPVEVLNFGGAEKWISRWGIFSGRIQIVVREVFVTHSSHRCTNHSQQCQQGRILFSIFCRSTHHDNTSSSVSAQAIFHTMLHIMPSRTTMGV